MKANAQRVNQEALDALLGLKANCCLKYMTFLYYKNGILPYPHMPWFTLSESWNQSPGVPLQNIC